MAASKAWEDGEEDKKLFWEIVNVLEMNKVVDRLDHDLANLMQARSRIDEGSEEEKAALEKDADDLTKRIEKEKEKGLHRRVPNLKVLSAVAVCKKYKDSEEILNLVSQGHRMEWAATVLPSYGQPHDCQALEDHSGLLCGFCRSVAKTK